MSNRAPHPYLNAFYGAGGSVNRIAAALAQSEAATAFLNVSLDDHPLATPPSWHALMSDNGAQTRVADVLGRLAQNEPGPVGSDVRTGNQPQTGPVVTHAKRSKSDLAATAITEKRDGLTDTDFEKNRHVLRSDGLSVARSSHLEPMNAPRHPKRHPFAEQKSPGTKAVTAPDLASETPSRGWLAEMPEHLRQACMKPVTASRSKARTAAVAQILNGTPVLIEETAAPKDTPKGSGLKSSEVRIAKLLSRIGGQPEPTSDATTDRLPKTTRLSPTASFQNPPQSTAPIPSPAGAAPRNGIERLLDQARSAQMISDVAPAASEPYLGALPAEERKAGSFSEAPRIDRPASGVPDTESLSQAVTDLIRREARAAGIDLDGGRR